MKKFYALLVVLMATTLLLVGCSKKELDKDASGEITVMLYNGDGNTYKDLGHQNLLVNEVTNKKLGTMYAVTKEFNKLYPNVKINVHFKQGASYDWATNQTWAQYRENFETTENTKIDIWSATDLAGDTTRGLVSDLSVFEKYDSYKTFNPAIMGMLNYYGVQAGLPQYLVPWGVYVNKSLAEEKNIDVPDVDWTMEEYASFVKHKQDQVWYGTSEVPHRFLQTGISTFAQLLAKQGVDGDFINVNNDETKALIPYLGDIAPYGVWNQIDAGNLDMSFAAENNWWTGLFQQNKLLTHHGDPWSIGDLANPVTSKLIENGTDWDYYPRPSTAKVENTVGVVIDPIAIRNFAMDDKDAKLSDAEFAKLQIAYEFAAFWVADTRSWEARSKQQFMDATSKQLLTTMDDSFPVTTGKNFDDQMDIWFELPTHQYFASAEKTPGFHKVLDLFKNGKVYDITDKAYPWNFDDNGSSKNIIDEWNQMLNPAYLAGEGATSPKVVDAGWKDAVLAKLPEWNRLMNERFTTAFANLKESLKKYYGKTDKDFK
ncbi:MAG: hypothetical protein RBQ97_00275 [Acholeplasma sp.]|nr:hypothetical protein [Acholeplasma sp.]